MADAAPPRRGEGNTGRACLLLVAAGACAVLALTVVSQFGSSELWDDSFMYTRYADNLLASGKLSWNPGGEATYGLTSPLYLAVVLPLRALMPGDPCPALIAGSLVSGLAFVALLVWLILKWSAEDAARRRLLATLALFWLALSAQHAKEHFVSGMDTVFGLAFLTAYIILAKRHEAAPTLGRAIALGVWGGLFYAARPDLLLYALALPAALVLLGPDAARRRHGLLIGGLTVAAVGLQMGLARLYFGSALPLSFYAKALDLYGGEGGHLRSVALRQLGVFLVTYWYLFLLAGVGAALLLRGPRSERTPLHAALLAATALFILYHLLRTAQIMGWASRYYYPVLPALVFLAAQSAGALLDLAARRAEGALLRVPRGVSWLAALMALYALMPQVRAAYDGIKFLRERGRFARFSLAADCRRRWLSFWFAMDRLAALPDDLVLATTDVGRLAALHPGKRVIDMAGLNETAFAHQRFTAARLFADCRPDVLYMPHHGYRRMNAEVRACPQFVEQYHLFTARQLAASSGIEVVGDVALWKRSRYYPALVEMMTKPY